MMQKFRIHTESTTVSIYVLCGILIISIFFLDNITPIGYELCFLYIIPLIIISKLLNLLPIIVVSCIGTLFTVASFFINPPGNVPSYVDILNRAICIIVLWGTVITIQYLIRISKKLLETEEYMKEEEKRAYLAAIVEHSSDAIFSKTIDGVITSWNKGAEKMYGYSADEIIGKPVSILIPPEYVVEMDDILHKIKNGSTINNFDAIRKKKNGTYFPISLTVSPIKNSIGQIIGASSVAQDITERKRIENERIRYANELSNANKELEFFSYSVAHDLRNPLHSASGFVNILSEDCSEKLNDECRDYVQRIGDCVNRMNSIIDDILALSKISRQEIELVQLDLKEMTQRAIDELQKSEPHRSVEVHIQEGLIVRADARLMSAALGNLIDNAWKYTSKVERPRIDFGSFKKDGKQIFFVKDNGAGFDNSKACDLFVPFKRFHPEKEFKGIGVGLAIVKKAINRHGGKVWAEGEVGKGATFFFTLNTE